MLLIRCNRFGQVSGTVQGLARLANLSTDDTRAALEKLLAPDPESTTPDEDGRRVVAIGPNLWQVTNYLKYRNMKDPEVEREQTRERVQRHRERRRAESAGNAPVTLGNAPVTLGNPIATATAEADTSQAADAAPCVESTRKAPKSFTPPTLEQVAYRITEKRYHFTAEAFIAHYQANGWRIGKNGMRDWRAACVTWEQRWLEEHGNGRRKGTSPPGGDSLLDEWAQQLEGGFP